MCHFYKYFYGLKQATRAWFRRLSQQLLKLGFEESKVDYSLFMLCTNTFITRSTSSILHSFIDSFKGKFHIRDLLDITKMISSLSYDFRNETLI